MTLPQLSNGLPFNLDAWIAEHRDLLKPPVGNVQIWRDADLMVVGKRGGGGFASRQPHT